MLAPRIEQVSRPSGAVPGVVNRRHLRRRGGCIMKYVARFLVAILGPLFVLHVPVVAQPAAPATYFDNAMRDDVLSGGVKMLPITTPRGSFHVWTKRIGNNPRIKVLLLHGGPGMTHEYLEAFDSYFPGEGIEYYYYDQLGSTYSDQPNDPELWTLPRVVEEVEQVRKALKLRHRGV